MMFSKHAFLTALALAGFAAEVGAQPIAPPRRPTFSTYGNIYAQGYGGYGGGLGPYGGLFNGGFGGQGFGGQGFGANALMQQQNLMLQQQLSNFNQNIVGLQNFLATGVNPNFPTTGHPAVFNNLGHWYGGGAGGGMMGGLATGRTAGIGMPIGGAGNVGAPGAPGGAGAAAQPRTAGTGIPIGGQRR
jgi:hypothetical protein